MRLHGHSFAPQCQQCSVCRHAALTLPPNCDVDTACSRRPAAARGGQPGRAAGRGTGSDGHSGRGPTKGVCGGRLLWPAWLTSIFDQRVPVHVAAAGGSLLCRPEARGGGECGSVPEVLSGEGVGDGDAGAARCSHRRRQGHASAACLQVFCCVTFRLPASIAFAEPAKRQRVQ